MYLNGNLAENDAIPSTVTRTTSAFNEYLIGQPSNSNDTGHFFNGIVDEFMFWSECMDATFVGDLYNASLIGSMNMNLLN